MSNPGADVPPPGSRPPYPGPPPRDQRPPPRRDVNAERVAGSGRTIADRYRLDRILGKGSMGTVWAAYDEMLHRRVAIKEIYVPDGTPAAEAAMLVERTLREARAIARLSHPNVITLYDILTLPSGPVIVMEVLAARSLGEVLKETGPLSVGQTATVGMAVAAGLSAAHAAGITHRDVKPGNVLIGGDGRIKLTDFGIARSAADNPMTATGLLLGSPAYIAPEVAAGAAAGPAADAWGLGALLYACVEGRPPFDKGAPVATLMAVVNDPIPPMRRAAELTPVIKGLMVKDSIHRLTLGAARNALRPLADDPVETRLIFRSAPRPPAPRPDDPRGGALRPGAGGPQRQRPGTLRPGAVGPSGRPALPGQLPRSRPPMGQGTRSDVGTGYPLAARPDVTTRAGVALPPPPWAAGAAQRLAPLPTSVIPVGELPDASGSPTAAASAAAGTAGRVPVHASASARRWIAIVVFLAAAILGFFGLRLLADTVAGESAPAVTAAVSAPIDAVPAT